MEEIINKALSMGADKTTAEKALENLTSKTAAWLVISGKMGSGKDSLAPAILPELGYRQNQLIGYSLPMREELQIAIDILTGRNKPKQALVEEVSAALELKKQYALEMTNLVLPYVTDPTHKLTGATRTEEWRVVLQKLGGYWRCEEDPEYWSKRVTVSCLEPLSKNISVYLTGGRFEPDVLLPKELGAKIIRLDVFKETQLARLLKRDGYIPSDEVLSHPGETALDNWDGFDVRVQNNGSFEEGLIKIVTKLKKGTTND